jgi:hypothetical protein
MAGALFRHHADCACVRRTRHRSCRLLSTPRTASCFGFRFVWGGRFGIASSRFPPSAKKGWLISEPPTLPLHGDASIAVSPAGRSPGGQAVRFSARVTSVMTPRSRCVVTSAVAAADRQIVAFARKRRSASHVQAMRGAAVHSHRPANSTKLGCPHALP